MPAATLRQGLADMAAEADRATAALEEALAQCKELKRRRVGRTATAAWSHLACMVGTVLGANPNVQSLGNRGSVSIPGNRVVSGIDDRGIPTTVVRNTSPGAPGTPGDSLDRRDRAIRPRRRPQVDLAGAIAALCARR